VWEFSDYSVIKASPRDIVTVCASAGTWDDGSKIEDPGRIAGCWVENLREIWIRWDMPEVLLHELCHLDGKEESECMTNYDWNEQGRRWIAQ